MNNRSFQQLFLKDHGHLISISGDDLMRYAGPSCSLAVAFCLRLFDFAFFELSPDSPPSREDIELTVACPCEGILDCIEMVTRSRTKGRLKVDLEAGPAEARRTPVGGKFYFEISLFDRKFGYWPANRIFSEELVEKIKLKISGNFTKKNVREYQKLKNELIGVLLGDFSREKIFFSKRIR